MKTIALLLVLGVAASLAVPPPTQQKSAEKDKNLKKRSGLFYNSFDSGLGLGLDTLDTGVVTNVNTVQTRHVPVPYTVPVVHKVAVPVAQPIPITRNVAVPIVHKQLVGVPYIASYNSYTPIHSGYSTYNGLNTYSGLNAYNSLW